MPSRIYGLITQTGCQSTGTPYVLVDIEVHLVHTVFLISETRDVLCGLIEPTAFGFPAQAFWNVQQFARD